MTMAHWIYLLGAAAIIGVMLTRKDVVVPALLAVLGVGWAYKGGFIEGLVAGLATVYNANIKAANELFGIILLIAFMVSMLNALKQTGADKKMVAPIKKLMVNGHVAYWVLFVATAVISTAFWPTPAIPLVAAVLMPAAAAAGLPPVGIAVAVTLAGQGMALAGDALMRVAPSISAGGAGIPDQVDAIANKGIVLTLIIGAIASVLCYMAIAKSIKKPSEVVEETSDAEAASETPAAPYAGALAIMTIVGFLLVVVAMIGLDLKGGDAGALVGGTAAVLMLIASFVHHGAEALNEVADRLKEGFGFAMKIMGSIIPIAAFFFMGGEGFSAAVLGEKAPGFLFDMVALVQGSIPNNAFMAAFGVLLVGILTGMDGSGFSGLPLTGALAGALSLGTGADVTMLAAVGQMGAIWTGGGTIVAWSSLVAVAGFAGISAQEVVRKTFLPVVLGMTIATILGVIIW